MTYGTKESWEGLRPNWMVLIAGLEGLRAWWEGPLPAGRALEPAWRVTELALRASEPAGRVSEPAVRVPEPAERALEPAERALERGGLE